MKITDLKNILAEIEEIYAEGGAKKTAEDFSELQLLFGGYEDLTVDEFVAELRRLYVRKSKPKLHLVEVVDELVVERYVNKLKGLAPSGEEDEAMLAALISDASVNKAEANVIQHRFLSGRERWPSKKAAIEAIRKRLAHRQQQAVQLERIKDVTPW